MQCILPNCCVRSQIRRDAGNSHIEILVDTCWYQLAHARMSVHHESLFVQLLDNLILKTFEGHIVLKFWFRCCKLKKTWGQPRLSVFYLFAALGGHFQVFIQTDSNGMCFRMNQSVLYEWFSNNKTCLEWKISDGITRYGIRMQDLGNLSPTPEGVYSPYPAIIHGLRHLSSFNYRLKAPKSSRCLCVALLCEQALASSSTTVYQSKQQNC